MTVTFGASCFCRRGLPPRPRQRQPAHRCLWGSLPRDFWQEPGYKHGTAAQRLTSGMWTFAVLALPCPLPSSVLIAKWLACLWERRPQVESRGRTYQHAGCAANWHTDLCHCTLERPGGGKGKLRCNGPQAGRDRPARRPKHQPSSFVAKACTNLALFFISLSTSATALLRDDASQSILAGSAQCSISSVCLRFFPPCRNARWLTHDGLPHPPLFPPVFPFLWRVPRPQPQPVGKFTSPTLNRTGSSLRNDLLWT